LLLFDDGSRNGVLCNGAPVDPRSHVKLSDGDEFSLGSATGTVRISQVTDPTLHAEEGDLTMMAPRERTALGLGGAFAAAGARKVTPAPTATELSSLPSAFESPVAAIGSPLATGIPQRDRPAPRADESHGCAPVAPIQPSPQPPPNLDMEPGATAEQEPEPLEIPFRGPWPWIVRVAGLCLRLFQGAAGRAAPHRGLPPSHRGRA
jgi:hypothetical protein